MTAEPFARIVAVDFSASNVPTSGRDSLWVAVAEGDGPIRTANPRTRHSLADLVRTQLARPGRSLVVLDVALGWPAGTARAIGAKGQPLAATTRVLRELLTDDDRNANNRFDVANELNRRSGTSLFWGHPHGRHYDHLAPTKAPLAHLQPRSVAERRLIEATVGGVIKSPLQLTGIGAVGGQSLLAQLWVDRLRTAGVDLAVWPFDPPDARVVVGEYFFSLADWRGERGTTPDERQVRAVVRFLRRELAAGRSPVEDALLDDLTSAQRRVVRGEEGWLVATSARGNLRSRVGEK